MLKTHEKIILGIDEAGRGPLAGPVMAAAVWLDRERMEPELLSRIDDSKKLSAPARVEIAEKLWELSRQPNPMVRAALGAASVREINQVNILNATFLAMARAVTRLVGVPSWRQGGLRQGDLRQGVPQEKPQGEKITLLIDGNRIPPVWRQGHPVYHPIAVIGGDGIHKEIAAASILAKTARDLVMRKLDSRYPQYGFAQHAGYGTQKHRAAIAQYGLTPFHRPLFCRRSQGLV
ncbi:MAG: ribonuclease HII [Candidatus Symbiobacter sp.]|nr:ribonuclease HII [Candidatus Symbiobacter sp.]